MLSNQSDIGINEINEFKDMRTMSAMFANVIAYDEATHTVTVQPVVSQEQFLEELEVVPEPMQDLEGVPVMDVMRIRQIPEAGNHGLLIFLDRNHDNYIETGGAGLEDTKRRHEYNDCIFLPAEIHRAKKEPLIIIEGDNVTINCAKFEVNADMFVKNGIEQISINAPFGTPL